MAGVRRVARSILRYFVPLVALLVAIQVFLAGRGLFGAKDQPIEDSEKLDLHRAIGHLIGQPVALLLLIVALLAWLPETRARVISILVPILLFVQVLLAFGGEWVGAFHPVNAFVVLGLLGYLASYLWRRRGDTAMTDSTLAEPRVAESRVD